MEQYIPKSTLVAEIENLLDKGRYHEEYDCAYRDGNNGALYALKSKLDSLEVKETDSTDVFIEKACSYLMEYEFNDSPTIADRRKRIEDFKNYLKYGKVQD